VFNPIRQSEKYDPLFQYIKKYVHELRDHECRELHDPIKHRIKRYCEPIVNHYEQIKRFKEIVHLTRIRHVCPPLKTE